jgi:hypothetical protein
MSTKRCHERKASCGLVLGVVTMLLVVGIAAADTWSDPAGDAQGGPDVTAVTVTNDPSGTVTMSIDVPPWASGPTGLSGRGIAVGLDTNLNGSDTDPTDRMLVVWVLFQPSVSSWAASPAPFDTLVQTEGRKLDVPSLRSRATATNIELSFARSELGIDGGFGFWIGSVVSVFRHQDGWSDRAPDSGYLTYALTLPPPPPPPAPPAVVKPVIGAPVASLARPVAGKKFGVTFTVTKSTDGSPLTSGTMVLDPSVSGKLLAHSELFKGGKARASILIPKTAKGKQLKIKVTVKSGGQSATRVATFRIR